jgi:transposase-like protein
MRLRRPRPAATRSAFAGFRFPPDVIVLAVRWYLRVGLSYRDLEELLAERGIEVDHVTIYRWVLRFTPLLAEAARPCRHAVGDRWQADETYVKVAGQWRYVYRAIDQFGQVIDVLVSTRRDATAARRFFKRAIGTTKVVPVEVVTDRAATYPVVLEELLPAAWHRTEQYANNRMEADHGRLKARLQPMGGLKQDRSARVVIVGHGFVQDLRRGHYELATEEPAGRRVAIALPSSRSQSDPEVRRAFSTPRVCTTQQTRHGSIGGADQVHARIDQDRAYVHALRDAGVPGDPRVDPSATFGKDGLPGVHERQLQHLARRRERDGTPG